MHGIDAKRVRQPSAQLEHALGVGPDRELAIFEFREGAGGPDRTVGEEGARKARLHHAVSGHPRRRAGFHDAVARALVANPVRFAGVGGRLGAAGPRGEPARGLRRPHRRHFVIGCEGDEVAGADNVDRSTGGAPHRGFIEVGEPRSRPRAAKHARMQQILGREIMNEG